MSTRRWGMLLLLIGLVEEASAKVVHTLGIGMHVYSPMEEVTEAVYGTGVGPFVFYEMGERPYLAVRLGVGFLRQEGEAYAGSRYLLNGPRSYRSLVPVEMVLCGRFPMSVLTLVVGGGIQRTFLREKYPESPLTRGNGFTTLFFAGPELALGGSFSLSVEYRITSGVVPVRNAEESFDVDVEAGTVQVVLRRTF